MTFLYYGILFFHVVACLFLIGVVLLQQGKGQDLASAFGGGGTQTAFGPRGSANVSLAGDHHPRGALHGLEPGPVAGAAPPGDDPRQRSHSEPQPRGLGQPVERAGGGSLGRTRLSRGDRTAHHAALTRIIREAVPTRSE